MYSVQFFHKNKLAKESLPPSGSKESQGPVWVQKFARQAAEGRMSSVESHH